eukprot:scaffold141342_cov22-Tisochrysis_lutea.AAC.2
MKSPIVFDTKTACCLQHRPWCVPSIAHGACPWCVPWVVSYGVQLPMMCADPGLPPLWTHQGNIYDKWLPVMLA